MMIMRDIFNEPEMLRLPGGSEIAVYRAGVSGPPVIFCHGFPELAYTWRHVLPAVATAGFQAIALDMPGFGRSSQPKAIEHYDIVSLTTRLGQVCRALGFERAIYVGHDWGSSVVWEMPLLQPDVAAGVIALNTPRWKYRRWGDRPLEYLRDLHGSDHYMLYFQQPGLPEAALMNELDAGTLKRFRKPPFDIFPIDPDSALAHQHLSAIRNIPLGETCLSDAEASVYIDEFRRTGFTGGLNYYRNIDRNAQLLRGTTERIDVPALMVAVTHDIYNPAQASEDIEQLGNQVERIVMQRAGHWLPDENRSDLPAALVSWLDRYRHIAG